MDKYNSIERRKPLYKINDTVKITSKIYGHGFRIGELVLVKEVIEGDEFKDYLVTNGMDNCWIVDEEIESTK